MRWLGIGMVLVGCAQSDEAAFEVVHIVQPECLTGIQQGAGVDFEFAGTVDGEHTRVLSMSQETGADLLLYCVPTENTWETFICDPVRTEEGVEQWSVMEIGLSELEISVDHYRETTYDAGAPPECSGWFSAWTHERVGEQTLDDIGAAGSVVAFGPPAVVYLLAVDAAHGFSAIGEL